MAYKLGNDWKMYVGTKAAIADGNYTVLMGEQNSSLNITSDLIETTAKEAWKTFMAGTKGATGNVTLFADVTDAQQKTLLASLFSGAEVFCFFGDLSDSTEPVGYSFTALVGSIGETADKGSVLSRDVALTATGVVTPNGLTA
jgi:predicted secreted protein